MSAALRGAGLVLLSAIALLASRETARPAGAPPAHDRFAPSDPVGRLQERIEAGDVQLSFDSTGGFLPSLLEALDIPVSSQTLVFSRTSLQVDRIGPWAPRALYFSDDVYVGWVQDGPIIEIASMDPQEGAVFYTLTQREDGPQRFRRETTTCLQCHESRVTDHVPGLIMRSILVDRLGYPIVDVHDGSTGEDTPFESRWGGWYVTGSLDGAEHAGNVLAERLYEEITFPERYLEELDMGRESRVMELTNRFDTTPYLSPLSDIVALMVLTHQVRLHNLMTTVQSQGSRVFGRPAAQKAGAGFSLESASRLSGNALDRLFQRVVFADELPLPGSVRTSSAFSEEFASLGPADAQGRSLRDFDLERRLFRYPVSFLIYSDAFTALPAFARNYVYDGLLEVLSADALPPTFAHLLEVDRAAILEILTETHAGFAERAAEVQP